MKIRLIPRAEAERLPGETRRCSKCGAVKAKTVAEFPVLYRNAAGEPVLYAYCRPCRRDYWRHYQRVRRAAERAS